MSANLERDYKKWTLQGSEFETRDHGNKKKQIKL